MHIYIYIYIYIYIFDSWYDSHLGDPRHRFEFVERAKRQKHTKGP